MKSTIASTVAALLTVASAVTPASSEGMRHAAASASCASEGALKSMNSMHRADISFVNGTKYVRVVYWLDFSGKRVVYDILSAGKTTKERSYLTHPWLIANRAGACLSVYLPVAGGSRVTL
jgi:hypothetical protein